MDSGRFIINDIVRRDKFYAKQIQKCSIEQGYIESFFYDYSTDETRANVVFDKYDINIEVDKLKLVMRVRS